MRVARSILALASAALCVLTLAAWIMSYWFDGSASCPRASALIQRGRFYVTTLHRPDRRYEIGFKYRPEIFVLLNDIFPAPWWKPIAWSNTLSRIWIMPLWVPTFAFAAGPAWWCVKRRRRRDGGRGFEVHAGTIPDVK